MGNAALCAGRGTTTPSDTTIITVLTADGTVMRLENTVRVADLLLEFPNHFMCHSSSLLLLQQVKILSINTTLIPGEVYLLVPIPGHEIQNNGVALDDVADTEYLMHLNFPQKNITQSGSLSDSCMKFVISPEQFARIMSGPGLKEGTAKLKRLLTPKRVHLSFPTEGNIPSLAPEKCKLIPSSASKIERIENSVFTFFVEIEVLTHPYK